MGRKRYFVQTFGCRVNQADSAGLAAALDAADGERRPTWNDADVVVLNTCTVTHRSDADVRKAVSRLQRENPDARVVVTGCYAQRAPEALVELRGVSAVVGNAHKRALVAVVDEVLQAPAAPVVVHTPMGARDPLELPPVEPVTTVLDRTRPFVKIQDGCDAHCTYCIIPEVRGRARSAAPEDVVGAVERLVADGWLEVVLAGVHLGTYAGGPDRIDLPALTRRVLDVAGLAQLRLSCIEPMAFPLALADIAAQDPRLAPHFHLPLQSGDDGVLKRMVRPYRAEAYRALLEQIRVRVPHACLGTDVIVGFPGESDAQFERTCRFIEASELNYVHVFSYSDREGTPSTRLDGKIDPRIIKERSVALQAVGQRLWRRYLDDQVGRTLRTLTLEPDRRDPEAVRALAANFCSVRLPGPIPPNRLIDVRIAARHGDHLVGEALAA